MDEMKKLEESCEYAEIVGLDDRNPRLNLLDKKKYVSCKLNQGSSESLLGSTYNVCVGCCIVPSKNPEKHTYETTCDFRRIEKCEPREWSLLRKIESPTQTKCGNF